jgi:hypothetical protein
MFFLVVQGLRRAAASIIHDSVLVQEDEFYTFQGSEEARMIPPVQVQGLLQQ